MRRLSLLLFFLVLSLPTTGCYSKEAKDLTASKPPNSQEPAKTEEQKDYAVWDFGKVKENAILNHNFVFKNDYNKALIIEGISTSCGCTASQVQNKNLAPGESTIIEVEFDTRDYSGPTKEHVYVYVNDIERPVIRFTIKAEVVK